MKNAFATIVFAGALVFSACQDGTSSDDKERSMSDDSTITGLEGTRDQSSILITWELKYLQLFFLLIF